MASNNHFECSICLHWFNDPVSTPCGHNYCKSCITDFWSRCDIPSCPLCKETFPQAPTLRVNTEFRDILEMFKRTSVKGDVSALTRSSKVVCDLCPLRGGKAVKSCLVCLASFCSAHLEPHHAIPALKWHELVPPLEFLQERACGNHKKVHQFFCRNDQQLICAACTKDVHVGHDFVRLEEEIQARKTFLQNEQIKIRRIMSEENVKCKMIQNSRKRSHLNLEVLKKEINQNFDDLLLVVKARKVEMMEQLEENQKGSEKLGKDLLSFHNQIVKDFSEISMKMGKLLHTGNDFELLQRLPSIPIFPKVMNFRAPYIPPPETIRNAVAKIQTLVKKEMDNIMTRISLTPDADEDCDPGTTENDPGDELKVIRKGFAQNVILDADTAHPALLISTDGRSVRDGTTRRSVPDNPSRFDCFHYVLGKEGFHSGKFYFEVSVKGQTTWEVGVVRNDVPRKGVDLSLSPEGGCWTLGSYCGRCQANKNPPILLTLSKAPCRVGVFVDFGERLVRFYDVNLRTEIYAFTQCNFSPSRRSSGLWFDLVLGTSTKSIFPIFRPGADCHPLRIVSFR